MKRIIAVAGASGFIGIHLVSELARDRGYEIRVLSRDKRDDRNQSFALGVKVFEGDLGDSSSLNGFLVPGCIVINLVYLWSSGAEINFLYTHNLLSACKEAKVARLIHCSTAAVAGRAPNDLVDEKTQCLPVTEYGITKLKIERDISEFAKDHFESVILRPTSVFGINGEPLKKLAADIVSGSRWKSYLKSCLFGRRRMNLIPIANVVAAIIFLALHTDRFEGEVFIVSDDDDPKNNFYAVERILMESLGIQDYRFPQLPVPLIVLKFILKSLGRNNINPRCDFDPLKLRKIGFKSPVSLKEGLTEYAAWYRSSTLSAVKLARTR